MNFFFSSLVGFAAGILASMGLGGGFVLVVYLALFTETAQKGAQGINLLFFIPITILAVILHIKNKMIDIKTALICSAIGAVAVVAGFYVAHALDNQWLRKVFAVFIIFAGLKDIFSKSKKSDKNLNLSGGNNNVQCNKK
ncbi:MAG: sulfite exporter TauE/SafE family protein [Oscillospiraceae bacterium]|nr:sulfite exporter TauE/SafE family protein [Oscillospiraceae bacterium]